MITNIKALNDQLISVVKINKTTNTKQTLELAKAVYTNCVTLAKDDANLNTLISNLIQFVDFDKALPGIKLVVFKILCLNSKGVGVVLPLLAKVENTKKQEEVKIMHYIINEHLNKEKVYIKQTILYIHEQVNNDETNKKNILEMIFIIKNLKNIDADDQYDECCIKLIANVMETKINILKHKLLLILGNIIANLKNKSRILDFVNNVFNGDEDHYATVLCFDSVYVLMTKYNFEFDNFYQTVYKVLGNRTIMSNRAVNTKVVEFVALIMDSNYVSTSIVKSFIKRLACIVLSLNITHNKEITALIVLTLYNMFKTNSSKLQDMIVKKDDNINSVIQTSYDESLSDLDLNESANKIENVKLWELNILQKSILNTKILKIIDDIIGLNFKNVYEYNDDLLTSFNVDLCNNNNIDLGLDWSLKYFR